MYKYEIVEERTDWAVIERLVKDSSIVQIFRFDKYENTIEEVLAYMSAHYHDFNVSADDVLYIVDDAAEQNMPCDTYGICGGTSCPQYFSCHA